MSFVVCMLQAVFSMATGATSLAPDLSAPHHVYMLEDTIYLAASMQPFLVDTIDE